MNKKKIMKLLKENISSCHKQLLDARSENFPELYIEGFRCRLDELLLLYHLIENKSFVDACKDLKINYRDVNVKDVKEQPKSLDEITEMVRKLRKDIETNPKLKKELEGYENMLDEFEEKPKGCGEPFKINNMVKRCGIMNKVNNLIWYCNKCKEEEKK